MLYFITENYAEAEKFIKAYKMKKQLTLDVTVRFDVFKSTDVALIISGGGTAYSAAAVGCLLTIYPSSSNEDRLISISAEIKGKAEPILCNEIHDEATGKYFYPFIQKNHNFIEQLARNAVSAVVFQAASRFLFREQIIIFENVSGENAEAVIKWIDGCVSNEVKDLPMFSHIYVENAAESYELTSKIKNNFKNSVIIPIKHYKDVFSPKGQCFELRKKSPKLVIAEKTGAFLYKGSENCPSYGSSEFYYATDILNCIYDCSYCYLRRLYPSADVVMFANIEDTFSEVRDGMYICVSYNSDMLALEGVIGFVRRWIVFASENGGVTIEVRTKSASFASISGISPVNNVILAWTLSPDKITEDHEKRTPSLSARLSCVKSALDMGWRVRICIDPVLTVENYETMYSELCDRIKETIGDLSRLDTISVGNLRFPDKNNDDEAEREKITDVFKNKGIDITWAAE